jgi:nucleoid DNA-binding protein
MMNKKVTYSDIVNALSRKTGFSKQKSEAFVKTLLNQVKDELKDSGKASITNFGSFKVKNVAEREGKNPQTGDPITIPAHKRVSFSPYKSLRESVNAEYQHLESKLIDEDEPSANTNVFDQSEETELAEHENEANVEDNKDIESESDDTEEGEVASEAGMSPPETEEESLPEGENSEDAEKVKSSNTDNEAEKKPLGLIFSKTEKKEEKNYTNLLASLAVLMLTIIAITSVWFLLDNGSGKGQQPNAVSENSTVASGQQLARSQTARTSESIKKEADALEKRINALIKEEERLRAAEKERVERLAAVKESSAGNESQTSEDAGPSDVEAEQKTQAYQVQEGEWYWVISEKVYGKPRFWPLLFMENHTVSEDPDSLLELTNINVPDMEGTASNPTKQDYKDLAAATKMVSEAYENAGKSDKASEYAKFARMWEQMGT